MAETISNAGKKSVFIVLSDIVYWFLFNFVSTNSHSIECIGFLTGATQYSSESEAATLESKFAYKSPDEFAEVCLSLTESRIEVFEDNYWSSGQNPRTFLKILMEGQNRPVLCLTLLPLKNKEQRKELWILILGFVLFSIIFRRNYGSNKILVN